MIWWNPSSSLGVKTGSDWTTISPTGVALEPNMTAWLSMPSSARRSSSLEKSLELPLDVGGDESGDLSKLPFDSSGHTPGGKHHQTAGQPMLQESTPSMPSLLLLQTYQSSTAAYHLAVATGLLCDTLQEVQIDTPVQAFDPDVSPDIASTAVLSPSAVAFAAAYPY